MDVTTPTSAIADELIARIDAAAPAIEAEADANEAAGRLNERTVELLRRIGVLEAMVPAEHGGPDLSVYDVLRVFDRLSYVDASAGWVAMIPGVQGKSLLLLDDDVRDRMSRTGYPFVAGQGAPNGRAIVTDGGYRVSGRWSYGSAILHCDTVVGLATVVDDTGPVLDAEGMPDLVMFYTPVANATIEGNWDVIGMRATGSVDYSISDVFVPEEMVARGAFTRTLSGRGQARLLGFTGWVMTVHCAVPTGAGRRLLDELGALARTPRGRGGRLADDPRFMAELGRAEAAYRGARALMYQAFGDAQERMNGGAPATRRDLTDMRTASVLMHDVNIANAALAMRESGGVGLRAGRLQRLYRDVVAMGQHLQAGHPTWAQVARDYVGEAEGMTWALNALV
ncbi:MAG: hypothetical protein BGO95_09975 [Micrococcales bacterium 73-13]|nr:MAG: hypothetical protein BGO95_09975 [Micrococcales bacterium 73-13]